MKKTVKAYPTFQELKNSEESRELTAEEKKLRMEELRRFHEAVAKHVKKDDRSGNRSATSRTPGTKG